ncbi:type VI secretion system tube protein TssD [Nocardioides sp.]|uniref:type VI secretion system tube protein TssD n=1 Tax=Nocardioides sp. TaxID=35761 RepID=UPI003784DC9D
MTLTLRRATLVRVALVLALAAALFAALTAGHGGLTTADAATASPIYGKCTGQEQGVIKSDLATKGKEGQYAISSVRHAITKPVDTQSGQASGRQQHEPLQFVTNVSSAVPKLINAMTDNETLTSCTFNFWRTTSGGAQENYFRVVLTNASVVSYHLNGRPGGQDTTTFELAYQTIEWTYVKGGVTAQDDWGQFTRQ